MCAAVQVIRHTVPDAFIAAAAPIAARGAASASFFSGWAHSLMRTPAAPGERVYLATCVGDGVLGVAIQRDSGPVILGQSDPAAAVAFAEDLAGDCPSLPGVVGSPSASDAFASRWRELTGRRHALRVRLRQHALTEVAEVPVASGAQRVAGEPDVEWLVDAQIAFIAEVGIAEPVERVRRSLPSRIARGDFLVWDDGKPVAYAGFNDAAPDFARIAPVYTFPDCRGRGYATALVAALSRDLLARGKTRLFLTTDVANPTSNAIYARIGFRAENDDCHHDFVDGEP
jgi:RimJ/RimL family protein N-acetyltransferase